MSKFYQGIVGAADRVVPGKLRPLWNHPAGPKTVFFWAPAFKWGLVLASFGDLFRPPEVVSLSQCTTLCITGFIWSRYSLVIIPVNYSLFSVNFFLGVMQLRQVIRVLKYQYDLEQAGNGGKKD